MRAAQFADDCARSVDNQLARVFAFQALTELQLLRGDVPVNAIIKTLDDCSRFGMPGTALYSLPWVLQVLQRCEEYELAATLHGFLAQRYWQGRSGDLDATSKPTRAALGHAEFERLAAKGQQMPFDDVVREARAALARHDSSTRSS